MESSPKKNITGKQLAGVIVVLLAAATGYFAYMHDDLTGVELGPDGKTMLKYTGQAPEFKIPRCVVYIGDGAFANNETLVKVKLHKDVARIGNGAFNGCSALEAVEVDANNKVYMSEDGVAMTKDGTAIVVCPNRPNNEYVVPQHVGSLGSNSFSACTRLEKLAFYETLSIFNFAFDGCTSLKTIAEVKDEFPKIKRPKVAIIEGKVLDPRGLAADLGVAFEGLDGVVEDAQSEAPAAEEAAEVEESAAEEAVEVEAPAAEEAAEVEAPAAEEAAEVEESAAEEAVEVEESAAEEAAEVEALAAEEAAEVEAPAAEEAAEVEAPAAEEAAEVEAPAAEE